MNPQSLQVEIRPRTPGQTVALAARMLQHRPGPLLAAWSTSSLPIFAVALLLLLVFELQPSSVWALMFVLAPLFILPVYGAVGLLVFTPSVSLGTVIVMTTRRMIPYVALFALTRVLTLLGLLALVVPGFYLWRNSWFLGPIVLLERSSLGASLRRSRRFATGFHGHVMAHAANAAAVLAYATLAFGSIVHFMIAELLGRNVAVIGELAGSEIYFHVVALTGFSLAVPLVALIWFFVYLDVRTRKEGWDLEIAFRTRAAQLEQRRG